MLFEYLYIGVPDSQGVLGSDHELVGVARVLEVVDQICQEGGKHIRQLEVITHITRIKQVVHTLQGVNNVYLIVKGVILEVPVGYLCRVLDKPLYAEIEVRVEVVHKAEFVHHKLDTVTGGH